MTSHLPSGTVTFVFTDIEKSTRLLGRLGDDYSPVLEKHRVLLAEIFNAHEGNVVDTHGDELFAAFPRPTVALEAAIEAQLALKDTQWPNGERVRVRMGIHTGEVKLVGNKYVGLEVHRAARIGAAGHGEQIVLSQSTRSLVEHSLPPDVIVKDLGLFRLKDLSDPEHLHQVSASGMPSRFPDLRTLSTDRHRIHPPPDPLIGREREKDEVMWLLSDPAIRLVTLTGPGGTGKTRLAREVAAEMQDAFEHGAVLVPLAPVSSGETVVQAILQSLGASEDAGRTPLESVKEVLRGKDLLLVLDNYEHVMDAAYLVIELLESTERLKILVTSREVLRLTAEREYPVPALSVPDYKASETVISQADSVRLFLERARSADPNFDASEISLRTIARICCLIDGLPLAIELAAARVRILPLDNICGRLEESLDLLSAGPRNLPERQRALDTAINWSYELLEEDEKRLLERLSVFAGWTLDAMAAVCQSEEIPDVFEGMASLIDKSLAYRLEGDAPDPRFSMLRSIREFAFRRLQTTNAHLQTSEAHARYFLSLAQGGAIQLRGENQLEWMKRIDHDVDNIRAATRWFLDNHEPESATEIGWSIWPYWWNLSRFEEGLAFMTEVLRHPNLTSEDTRGKAAVVLGALSFGNGRMDQSIPAFEMGLESCNRAGNDLGAGLALSFQGVLAALGEPAQAESLLDRAHERLSATGEAWAIGFGLFARGRVLVLHQRFDEAKKILNEAVEIIRPVRENVVLGLIHINLGWAHLGCDNVANAAEAMSEGLTYLATVENGVGIARALEGHAAVNLRFGHPDRAAILFGAAEGVRRSVGVSVWLPDSFSHAGTETAIKAALDSKRFDSLWNEGLQLSTEDAIKLARSMAASAGRS